MKQPAAIDDRLPGFERGLRVCRCAGLLERAYAAGRRRLRSVALRLALRWEGGNLYSRTLRRLLLLHHGVRVGAYTYGACMRPGGIPAGVDIGRYCSIADGVQFFLRNHPYRRLSMHPFFYNRWLGYVEQDTIETGRLSIGHDVWLGHNALVTPGCTRIGVGAVVAAGAVVTHDVPAFALVAGNPARVLRMRFDEATCEAVLRSRWWESTVEELLAHREFMLQPLAPAPWRHPLLSGVWPQREPQTANPQQSETAGMVSELQALRHG